MSEKLASKKKMILEKPSATVSITDPMTALQRKFYNAFLYIAKESLKKDVNQSEFKIPLNELKKFFDIDDKKNTYIKKRIEELVRLTAQYNILSKDKEEWGIFSILPYVKIYMDNKTNTGIVKFEIPTIVKKAIINKEKNFFAKIDLVIIRGLKSKYAVILYELLKDYHKAEIPEMDIETFRKIFGITNKYKLFQNLKIKVLKPAVNEINDNKEIDFIVSYELRKRGNVYTHIKFHLKPKAKKVAAELPKEIENKLKQVSNELIREIIKHLQEKNIEYVMSNIRYANKNAKENYIAYLLQALKNDWAQTKRTEQEEENKYRQTEEEYQKFIGKTVTLQDGEYTVGESGICNRNSAIPLGDIVANWEQWKSLLEEKIKSRKN